MAQGQTCDSVQQADLFIWGSALCAGCRVACLEPDKWDSGEPGAFRRPTEGVPMPLETCLAKEARKQGALPGKTPRLFHKRRFEDCSVDSVVIQLGDRQRRRRACKGKPPGRRRPVSLRENLLDLKPQYLLNPLPPVASNHSEVGNTWEDLRARPLPWPSVPLLRPSL